jgi:hypothetical protein
MACEKNITSGFELDCTSIPTKGIVQSVTIMNTSDIDKGATVFNATNEELIESMVLKSGGKQAYLMTGVKTLLNGQATFAPKDDTFDGWIHTLIGYIGDLNPSVLEQLKAYTNGAEITAILEMKYLGADGTGSSRYKVFGYDQGMVLTEAVFDANVNGGLPFTLSNKDGFENNGFPYAFFDTDDATTEAAVAALLTPTA